jgi:hypothetical protein
VLGELLSSNGHGDGKDGRHGDGDTSDQEDEDVVQTVSVRVSEVGVEDEDLEDDEDTDGDHAEESDLGEDSLEMTGGVVVLSDKSGGSSKEGVGTSRDDDTLGLSLLAGRSAAKGKDRDRSAFVRSGKRQ